MIINTERLLLFGIFIYTSELATLVPTFRHIGAKCTSDDIWNGEQIVSEQPFYVSQFNVPMDILKMFHVHVINIFRVTYHLCGDFTDHRWIPRTKASDAELWFFSFDLRMNKRLRKQLWGWWFETPSSPLLRYCNVVNHLLIFHDITCCFTAIPLTRQLVIRMTNFLVPILYELSRSIFFLLRLYDICFKRSPNAAHLKLSFLWRLTIPLT